MEVYLLLLFFLWNSFYINNLLLFLILLTFHYLAPPSNANNLDIIQGWCEHLADILWNTREQIKMVSKYRKQLNVDEQNLPDFLPELFSKVTGLLEHLITRSFIIEKQPPQVMKTNTRYVVIFKLFYAENS